MTTNGADNITNTENIDSTISAYIHVLNTWLLDDLTCIWYLVFTLHWKRKDFQVFRRIWITVCALKCTVEYKLVERWLGISLCNILESIRCEPPDSFHSNENLVCPSWNYRFNCTIIIQTLEQSIEWSGHVLYNVRYVNESFNKIVSGVWFRIVVDHWTRLIQSTNLQIKWYKRKLSRSNSIVFYQLRVFIFQGSNKSTKYEIRNFGVG